MKKNSSNKKITMNLPNKLTLLRIILVPVIVIIYMIGSKHADFYAKPVFEFFPNFSWLNFVVLIVFAIAAFTDYLDGAIARKQGLVTNFGKFADPLADKLLVYTVFVLMLEQNYLNKLTVGPEQMGNIFEWWMLVVVLAREFIVTGVRYMAASNKKVIAASKLGKAKTIAQYIAVVVVLLLGAVTTSSTGDVNTINVIFILICKVSLFVMLVLTVISGIDYVVKNKEVFYDKKGE